MSSSRSKLDRNREKVIQDRLQVLLGRMLQDEDNKYCIDCDSKGPRWASWNIGIFLCIRCAGIHRNLGVHISKVKSVNLDSWTPQQVASMQIMGNSKGRAVYEARVPEDWRRPQNDSALETFIRAKYEKKKYIAREWTPSKPPDHPLGWAEIIEAEKQKKDIRSIVLPSRAQTTSPEHSAADKPAKVPVRKDPAQSTASPVKANTAAVDLLGLTTGPPAPANPLISQQQQPVATEKVTNNFDLLCLGSTESPAAVENNTNDFNDFVGVSSNKEPEPQSNGGSQMSKDSIMALFNKPAASTQPRPPAPVGLPGQPQPQMQGFMMGNNLFPQQQQQQQQPVAGLMNQQLNQFGLQNQPPATQNTTMNNPFLSNTADLTGFGAMNGATTNGGKQAWGFN